MGLIKWACAEVNHGLGLLDEKRLNLVQQAAHAFQHGDILRPVEATPAGPLHRADEGELGFPEPQHMLRHVELLGRLRNGSKGFRTLGHTAWRILTATGRGRPAPS